MYVCALARVGLGGVQGIHEASLPYQRHARLSVLMVITLPTIGTLCSDRNNKKKMDGWMRRRGIKGKRRGGYNWLGLSGYVNTAHLFN